jgi:hypothetical protein
LHTPAFLLWAVKHSCPIRGFQDGSNPERTERHLRAARTVSDARSECRVLEGLCVEPPYGFRIDDALAIYGGIAAIEQACSGCPANAASRLHPNALAGCFGLLPLSANELEIHNAVDAAILQSPSAADFARHFPVTRPAWYGLWINSPLDEQQAALLLDILATANASARFGPEFSTLQAGLQAAVQHNLRLHVTLYPPGRVEGVWWRLAPHCRRCQAPWNSPTSLRCGVCGHSGRPVSGKQRRARGRRPYFPLDRLLGSEAAAEFLLRYEALRAPPRSIPPAQSPPLAAPPDNPPAG